jgi:hypothetical protein
MKVLYDRPSAKCFSPKNLFQFFFLLRPCPVFTNHTKLFLQAKQFGSGFTFFTLFHPFVLSCFRGPAVQSFDIASQRHLILWHYVKMQKLKFVNLFLITHTNFYKQNNWAAVSLFSPSSIHLSDLVLGDPPFKAAALLLRDI